MTGCLSRAMGSLVTKVFIKTAPDGTRFCLRVGEFNDIVDQGYEFIVIVTPTHRWTSTVEDWQDYGYYSYEDNGGQIEITCLSRGYMSLS